MQLHDRQFLLISLVWLMLSHVQCSVRLFTARCQMPTRAIARQGGAVAFLGSGHWVGESSFTLAQEQVPTCYFSTILMRRSAFRPLFVTCSRPSKFQNP